MPATLQRPTLVLNRNWQPIRVSTVARALILVWNDHARIVDPADFQTYDWSDWSGMAPQDGELFIQAVTYRLRVPEVVALTNYDRVPLGKVASTAAICSSGTARPASTCLLYTSPSPRDS